MLRALIGLAAVVVIAAGGVYLWQEFSAYRQTQEDAAQRQTVEHRQSCQQSIRDLQAYKRGETPQRAESRDVTEVVVEICLEKFPDLQ